MKYLGRAFERLVRGEGLFYFLGCQVRYFCRGVVLNYIILRTQTTLRSPDQRFETPVTIPKFSG